MPGKLSANSAGNKNRFSHKKRIIRILTAAAVVVLLLGMSWLLNLGLPEVGSCSTGTARDDSPRELQSYITTDKWRDGESRAGFHAGTGKKWDSD